MSKESGFFFLLYVFFSIFLCSNSHFFYWLSIFELTVCYKFELFDLLHFYAVVINPFSNVSAVDSDSSLYFRHHQLPKTVESCCFVR